MRHPERLVSTSASLRDRRANTEVMTCQPPRRTVPPPYSSRYLSPRCLLYAGRRSNPTISMKNIHGLFNYSYFIWFWQTDTAVDFAFSFLASLAQSYITCMVLLNVISNYSHWVLLILQHYVSIFIILFNNYS